MGIFKKIDKVLDVLENFDKTLKKGSKTKSSSKKSSSSKNSTASKPKKSTSSKVVFEQSSTGYSPTNKSSLPNLSTPYSTSNKASKDAEMRAAGLRSDDTSEDNRKWINQSQKNKEIIDVSRKGDTTRIPEKKKR